jgi:alpha-1,2-mannosyltransferase
MNSVSWASQCTYEHVCMSMTLAKAASWLTPKRLRVHGLLLALCLWPVYFWNMAAPGLLDRIGNLKGTDFLHFYTLGSLALGQHGTDHRGPNLNNDLYNMQAQSAVAAERVPAAQGIRYLPLYPPQVSIFFAPFARLSYPHSLILWLALSALIYSVCVYAFWRICPNLQGGKLTVAILALAFPAFWHLIAWGQTSALALACFTLAYFALRAQQEFVAGLALGFLIFKPQLGVAAAVIFVATRRWKVIAGALLSASSQLAAAWIYYGPDPLRMWIKVLWRVPTLLPLLEPKLFQTYSLRTFWTMLLPWPRLDLALYIVTALLTLALGVRCWQSDLSLPLRYSALLLASVLVAPHLTVYDLVILAPAFLLLSDWIIAQPGQAHSPNLKLLLYLAFILPLAGPLARWTHLQLSVPVMLAILCLVFQLGRRSTVEERRFSAA